MKQQSTECKEKGGVVMYCHPVTHPLGELLSTLERKRGLVQHEFAMSQIKQGNGKQFASPDVHSRKSEVQECVTSYIHMGCFEEESGG